MSLGQSADTIDSVVLECYTLAEAYVSRRVKRALENGQSSFELCEPFGFAVTIDLKKVKERLRSGLASMESRVHALDDGELLIEAKGIFAALKFTQKPKYCAARLKVWADDATRSKQFETAVRDLFAQDMVKGVMFGLRWAYQGARGLDDVYVEEVFDDDLVDEAYPCLAPYGGVTNFVDQFLDSDETVLILQGTAGSGKTRLVRKILAEMSRKATLRNEDEYGSKATALYTGDQKALESDEIFARFITGEENAFVVEDADHMLRPRVDGNDNLHRFLAVADGVVRAAGRKVIFSTNLPNISDIDDALTRPGRCFATLHFQELNESQALALGAVLSPGVAKKIEETAARGYTVAKVYAMAGKNKTRLG